ncbi:acyl-CoA N-acyltransferase [Amniculicola lignicola CBS 123094]|uniref:Acyl-CoA N-acyltransferase n=1 Tax=Amniculicola lignicola CBS 123094 TaxID=1392246 RepID=A0A6A5X2S2_9PLEO|nr:acyl-CoA N-acyltransferase [Amniculicola lignicola CBS 123094]
MPFRLLPADMIDIPSLVDVYFETFKSPLVMRVKPDVPPVRDWYQKSLENDFKKPNVRIYKVVDNGEIIAFAKWTSPHTEPSLEKPNEWPVEGDVALFEEAAGKALAKRKQIMGEEEHWYLAALATLPKSQRRGAGSMLMSEFCKQVDEAGHRSYVTASRLGRPTYERFSFQTQDTWEVVIDGEPYVDCCMVREPQKPKKMTE